MASRYAVMVWNTTNGDIEKYFSDVSDDELDGIRESYSDEPWLEVVIEKEWGESDDD